MRNTIDKRSVCGGSAGGRKEGYQETRTSCTSYPSVPQRREDLWEFHTHTHTHTSCTIVTHPFHRELKRKVWEFSSSLLLLSLRPHFHFQWLSGIMICICMLYLYLCGVYVVFVDWMVMCAHIYTGPSWLSTYYAICMWVPICMYGSREENCRGAELNSIGKQLVSKFTPSGPQVVPMWSPSGLLVNSQYHIWYPLSDAFQNYGYFQHCTWLYLPVPGWTWLYLLVLA